MKNFLITGGFGFIGLNLINSVLKDNLGKVHVIDSDQYPYPKEEVQLLANSIEDLSWISKDIDLDGVVLLAGISGKNIKDIEKIHKLNVDVNVEIVEELIKYNKRTFHVVIPSSQLVYGNSSDTRETLDLSPEDPYAQSKLELEKELLALSSKYEKLSVTSFRISNPFGPHIPVPQK